MKTLQIIKYVFLAVGLALLAVAAVLVHKQQGFMARAELAHGTVVALAKARSGAGSSSGVAYHPVVEFQTGGGQLVRFRSSISSNPASHSEGEAVTVYYDRQRPQDARINSFFALWGGATITGGLGSVFFAIGAVMAWWPWRARRRAQQLMTQGTPVRAELQPVERNTALDVNGQHPWRLVAQWKNPVTADLYIFKSANLWFDPSSHLQGGFVMVYIDSNNPKRYHMDLSFLPKVVS
jgi:hypothetical protein